MLFCFGIYRYDVNLPVFLDYEIWKSSYMLAQDIPCTQALDEDDNDLVDFEPNWKQENEETKEDEEKAEKEETYENHIVISIE